MSGRSLCCVFFIILFVFFFNDTATTEIYTLSLHDALPLSRTAPAGRRGHVVSLALDAAIRDRSSLLHDDVRSEEHTSELQSHSDLVCRLLLEKKKKIQITRVSKTKKTKNKVKA